MSAKGKEFKVNVSTDRATAISSSAGSYPNVLYFPIDDDNVIIFNGNIYDWNASVASPKLISSGDLNTYRGTQYLGVYYANYGNSISNKPSRVSQFALHVLLENNDSSTIQVLYSKNKIYTRAYESSSWSSWTEIGAGGITSIPQASSSALGGIKIGYSDNGRNYAVELDSSGKAFVNVPWTDTNTHYTTHLYAGTGSAANASTTNGNTKLTVTDDSTVRSTITLKGSGGTSVTSDASGNVTVNSPSVTLGTLGITATAAELNYCDGVTSNIQTQLNGKSATNHNHNSSYVSALGTSGNYVTWTKNGTTNNITVPYSSNSDKLGGLKRWYSISFNNKPCLRIITLTVLATYINIPITFDIQGRSSNAKSSISISFNSENNTDPTIQNVYYIGDAKYGRNIRVYKSGTGIWEVWLKQQEEGYDSVVISNISYESSNIKFEITESSADALPSYSTYKDSSLFVLDNNISGTAANANKTTNSLVLKFNSGTSEGNNLYTFNGSSGKTIDIKSGSNVSLSTSGNTVTISSTNTTYGLASTSSNGLLRQLNGNTSQFMRGDGNWGTPINTTYSQATSSTLGLVKIGFPESGQNYPVELNSSGQMYVNVPWTDNNTTYSAGAGLSLSGTNFSLVKATPTTLGGVKVSSTEIRTVSAVAATTFGTQNRIYPVQLAYPSGSAGTDGNKVLSVYVPWKDTTYSVVSTSKNGLVSMDSALAELAYEDKDAGNLGSLARFGEMGMLEVSTIVEGDLALVNKSNSWTAYQDFKSGAGNSGSDMRFKREVTCMPDVLDNLMSLNVIKYIWEHPDENGIRCTFGVKADQLLSLGGVYATMVHSRADKYDTKWVEYDRFGVLAIKALQEVVMRNKQLESRIEYLEDTINSMRRVWEENS